MLKRLVESYRNSGVYAILNWHEEKAVGRSCMLLAGVLGALYTNMAGGVFFTCFLLASGLDITAISFLCAIPFLASICAMFSPQVLAPFRKRKKILGITRLIFHLLQKLNAPPSLITGCSALFFCYCSFFLPCGTSCLPSCRGLKRWVWRYCYMHPFRC